MSQSHRALALSALVLAGAQLAAPAQAARSYDNCTGFIDSLPATITEQGVWCLRANLGTSLASGTAITIAANNVTIDCNDFKLGGLAAGDGSLTTGIRATDRLNAVVRNCGIRGFLRGVYLTGGGHLVEGNRLDQNLYIGISMSGDDNLVRDNRVLDTGGSTQFTSAYGIYGNADALGNEVSGVHALTAGVVGISIFNVGAEVSGNRVRRLVPAATFSAFGVWAAGAGSVVRNNTVVSETAVEGTALLNTGSEGVCTGNAVHGFAVDYSGCTHTSGNLPTP